MPSALADRAARLRTWLGGGGNRALLGVGAAVVLLLAAILVWVFGGGAGRSGNSYPQGLVPSAGPTPTAVAGPGGGPSALPRPGATGGTDPADQNAKGFLNELGAIDPALAANPDAALAGGRAACQDLAARLPDETVRAHVVQRFHLGTSTEDQAKSALIVDAARNHLCP